MNREKSKTPETGDSAPDGAEVLQELESLSQALGELNGAVQRLHEKLSRFLPKMADSAADEDGREGASPEAAVPADVDELVEDRFKEIFGEEKAVPEEEKVPAGAPEDTKTAKEPPPSIAPAGERRASDLRLRFQQGERVLEVPWSWVQDASAREIEEQGRGAGRIRLEDETGEADIPVDRILGVVLSATEPDEREPAFRPRSVQDLVQWRTGQVAKEELAPGEADLERVRGCKVAVASPSGIVRRFLRRHLESMGLVVLETEDPKQSSFDGGLLGVFWDRDLSSREARTPPELPVVQLSHHVEQSRVSSKVDRPLLAKPFSREEVARAVVWMESRSRTAEVLNRGESQSGPDTSASRSGRESASPNPPR